MRLRYSHLMPDDGAPPRKLQWSGAPLRVDILPDVTPTAPSPEAEASERGEPTATGAASTPLLPPSPSEDRDAPNATDVDSVETEVN